MLDPSIVTVPVTFGAFVAAAELLPLGLFSSSLPQAVRASANNVPSASVVRTMNGLRKILAEILRRSSFM